MGRPTIEEQKPITFCNAIIEDWEVYHQFDINSLKAEFKNEFSESHLTLYGKMLGPYSSIKGKPVEISISEDFSDYLIKSNRELELAGQGHKKTDFMGGGLKKEKDREEYKVNFSVPSSYFHRLTLSIDALLPALFLGYGREWERNGAYLYDFDIKAYREGEPVNIKGKPVGDCEVKIKNALKKIEVLENEIQRIKGNLKRIFDQ